MNNLESGLFLPIRFYSSLDEQDRYKSHVEGVAFIDLNYVHVDCVALAPFQVVYDQMDVAQSIQLDAICVDTNTLTNLPYNIPQWEEYVDIDNQLVYTSYLGNGDFSGLLSNGMYYFKLTIVDAQPETRYFYSDIFVISNCSSPDDTAEYRKWNQTESNLRSIDVSDLRITKE